MKEPQSKVPLIIGLSIPVVLILVISFAVYWPQLTADPQYDFVYGTKSIHMEEDTLTVVVTEDGVVELREGVVHDEQKPLPVYELGASSRFFIFDIETNTNKEVALEELQQNYHLDPKLTSPDGYYLERDTGHAGIFELFGFEVFNLRG